MVKIKMKIIINNIKMSYSGQRQGAHKNFHSRSNSYIPYLSELPSNYCWLANRVAAKMGFLCQIESNSQSD